MEALATQVAGRAVLVTGASGFIGAHLCNRLLAYGAEVHAVSRQARRSDKKNLQWWQTSLRDVDAVRRLVKDTRSLLLFSICPVVWSGPVSSK